jgi:hypothetical protein
MDRNEFKKRYNQITRDYYSHQKDISCKIRNLLALVGKEIGDFFLSKGFIYHNHEKIGHGTGDYYYDPVTKIGFLLKIPKNIDIDMDYNYISLLIVYKTQNNFLHYNKCVYFRYKKEDVEMVYLRFKKYLGKTEINRIKESMRQSYPKEMLIVDRNEKLKKVAQN